MCHESLIEAVAGRCRAHVRRVLPPGLADEYIAEAEHGDGIGYWIDHFAVIAPDGSPSIDFDRLDDDAGAFLDAMDDEPGPAPAPAPGVRVSHGPPSMFAL